MTMRRSMEWHEIDCGQGKVSDLFLATVFDGNRDDGYRIYLSDLTRIWSQALDKRAILQYAERTKCPINPSEDATQYPILIARLQAAANQHGGTTLKLLDKRDGRNDFDPKNCDNITMVLTSSLPKPLQSLEWICDLQLLEEDTARSMLLHPLLANIRKLEAQIKSLRKEIDSRDHVITQIWEVFDANPGMNLHDIFPILDNIQSREEMGKCIKGLAQFDDFAWQKRFENDEVHQLYRQKAADRLAESMNASISEYQSAEWNRYVYSRRAVKIPTSSDTEVGRKDPEEADNTSTHKKHGVTEQQSTDTIPRKRKLGMIGGRRDDIVAKQALTNVRPATDKPKAEVGTDGGNKVTAATQENSDVLAGPDVTKAVPTEPVNIRPKVKLGTIGGKKSVAKTEENKENKKNLTESGVARAVEMESEETEVRAKLDNIDERKAVAEVADSETASEASTTSPPRRKRKTGVIGGGNTNHDIVTIKQEPAVEEQQDAMSSESNTVDSHTRSKEEQPTKRKPLMPAGRKRMF